MANRFGRMQIGLLFLTAILLVITLASSAFAANGRVLANSTPRFVQDAQNLGPENPTKVIPITVRLQQHNVAERDAFINQLYTPGSPQYHQWLTPAQYAAKFGPTAQEAALVQDFLKSHGLTVTAVHQNNFYVNAQGSIADIQKAFNVQINRFNVKGKTIYSNISNASIAGPAAEFVSSVQGLHPVSMQPRSIRPVDPETGQPYPEVPLNLKNQAKALAGPPPSLYYENQCWRAVESHGFTTGNTLPAALYTGNRYGGDIHGGTGHLPPCGYEPAALQIAYGLQPLISAGNDGTGQTVVIVDAWGSPTATADFGVFASTFGLTSGIFADYNPFGADTSNTSWAGETTLDIEWSHAMAPSANIALVRSIDNYDNNLQNAIQWALDNSLGNQISNSYGSDEYENDAAGMQSWDDLNAEGAALGVSINFSTGDSGDFYRAVGAYTVSVPSDSPHATAVGGTSDFINADYTMKFQAGWGTDLTRIAAPTTGAPNVPPVCASTLAPGKCFYFGGGGGQSTFFAKPTWQGSLPGTGRQQPDISMTADPYTGVEIIYSYNHPGTYSVSVIGGTSASCPMFSGVWAIVNQKSQQLHGKAAGLAAPYMYTMPSGSIKDVKQSSAYSGTNLTGTIFTGGPPTFYSATAVVTPDISTAFTSAFYQGTSTRWYAISFGTDSTLLVTNGWDDVTGVGTPYGAAFVNGVVNQVH